MLKRGLPPHYECSKKELTRFSGVIKYEESEVWREKQKKVEERLWVSMTRRKPTRGESLTRLLLSLVVVETVVFSWPFFTVFSPESCIVYRVTHLLADLGWVDLDLGCSTGR